MLVLLVHGAQDDSNSETRSDSEARLLAYNLTITIFVISSIIIVIIVCIIVMFTRCYIYKL